MIYHINDNANDDVLQNNNKDEDKEKNGEHEDSFKNRNFLDFFSNDDSWRTAIGYYLREEEKEYD